MRKILTLLTVLVVGCSLFAKPITIEGTTISLVGPEGFKPLSKETIEAKWPSYRTPIFAIGNENSTTTVACELSPNRVTQDLLEEAQDAFTGMFERKIPSIEWKRNEIIELSDQRWVYMEMTSHAVDTNIYNIMLITGYHGLFLAFNFDSTKEDFPKYEKALRDSILSIKLK